MYAYECKVVRVLDGDTLDMEISLGFRLWYKAKVRLIGLNAPELKVLPDGPNARAHLETLLLDRKVVVIHTTLNHEFEKYGRVLGALVADGVNINMQMVADGFAVPMAS